MGEVKVRITLTNATDEVIAKMNPGKRTKVRQLEIEGVVDTGAVALILPPQIANKLGLPRMGKQVAEPTGSKGPRPRQTASARKEKLIHRKD